MTTNAQICIVDYAAQNLFPGNEMVYFSVYPNLTTWHLIFYYVDSGFS